MVEAVAEALVVAGHQLGSLETRPYYFKLQWPTNLQDERLFQATRELLAALKDTVGDEPETVKGGKAFPPSIVIMNSEGKGEMSALENFMEGQRFSERVREFSAVYARLNTPYGDILMDLEGNGSERSLYVASHLDLSVSLAHFVAQTHKDLSKEMEPEVLNALSDQLMQYQ